MDSFKVSAPSYAKRIARTLDKRIVGVSEVFLERDGTISVVLDDVMRTLCFDGTGFPQGYVKYVSDFSKKFSEYEGAIIPIELCYQDERLKQEISGIKQESVLLRSLYSSEDREIMKEDCIPKKNNARFLKCYDNFFS